MRLSETLPLTFHLIFFNSIQYTTTVDVILNNYTLAQDRMFFHAKKFNQGIGSWNVSSGTNFVSLVVYLSCVLF